MTTAGSSSLQSRLWGPTVRGLRSSLEARAWCAQSLMTTKSRAVRTRFFRTPYIMMGLLLTLLAIDCTAGRSRVPVLANASVPIPGLDVWEDYTIHLATWLRVDRQLSGLHIMCSEAAHCVSAGALRRIDLAVTLLMGRNFPLRWPTTPRMLVVLVDLDCTVLQNMAPNDSDVVLLVSTRDKEGTADIFETCWKTNMLHVLLIHQRDSISLSDFKRDQNLEVYTYEPYLSGACHDMRPRLAALWTPSSPLLSKALGLRTKDLNLAGCPLRISSLQFAPPRIKLIPNNSTSQFTLIGTFAYVMNSVATVLNFTPVYMLPSDDLYGSARRYPNFGGILGDVFHNRSDIGLIFSGSDINFPWHARPASAQAWCTTWCIPTGYRKPNPWQYVIEEFTPATWACVGASYIVATITYRFLLPGKKFQDTWLTALQGLISCIDKVPEDWAPRVFLFCWSFFGMVVATIYTGALHGICTAQTDSTIFRSLADLADSDIPLYMDASYVRDYSESLVETDGDRRVMARATPYPSNQTVDVYLRMIRQRDIAVLMDRTSCLFYGREESQSKPFLHVLKGYCLSVSCSSHFVTRQRWPYLRRFTDTLKRLDEGGIISRMLDPQILDLEGDPDPVLRMHHLAPFLRVLGVGAALAFLVLLGELGIAR